MISQSRRCLGGGGYNEYSSGSDIEQMSPQKVITQAKRLSMSEKKIAKVMYFTNSSVLQIKLCQEVYGNPQLPRGNNLKCVESLLPSEKEEATCIPVLQTMQSVEEVLSSLSPELLALQERWWISFLFGTNPQRPHESYELFLHIQGLRAHLRT